MTKLFSSSIFVSVVFGLSSVFACSTCTGNQQAKLADSDFRDMLEDQGPPEQAWTLSRALHKFYGLLSMDWISANLLNQRQKTLNLGR